MYMYIYIYDFDSLSIAFFHFRNKKKKNIQRTEKSLLSEFTRVSINKLRSNNNFASYEILGVYICSGLYVHWEQFFFFFSLMELSLKFPYYFRFFFPNITT